MRLAPSALAYAVIVGGCSTFGEAGGAADAGTDAPLSTEAGALPEAGTGGKAFCPIAGAIFCADFEGSSLTAGWGTKDAPDPSKFLSLEADPEHGHVLRVKLDATSVAQFEHDRLQATFARAPTMTYAADVRVDTRGTTQELELVSLKTAASSVDAAFHIGIDNDLFFFAEFTDGLPRAYERENLMPVDASWHHFEVTVTYATPIHVRVGVDGKNKIERAARIVPASTALPDTVALTAGVNYMKEIGSDLRIAIDNVALFAR